MKVWTGLGLTCVACVGVSGEVLMDNGSLGGAGRAMSAQWRIYQPFVVTGAGWNVTSIGVDGFRDIDPEGLGMHGAILKDDGTGEPNESDEPALTFDVLLFPHAESEWVDVPVSVSLVPGQYWIRWSSNDEFYYGAVWRGTTGQDSWSVNNFSGQVFPSDPTALRMMGEPLPPVECGDANGDGSVDFADLNIVLSNWGEPGPDGDLNQSGMVDFADLNLVLGGWDQPCP